MARQSIMVAGLAHAVNVMAALQPRITPAARLEERQNVISWIWSPVLTGTDVIYNSFDIVGNTVTSSAIWWNWCSAGGNCNFFTNCDLGTMYDSTSSLTCDATANICGIEYLATTTGAPSALTRLACYPTDATVTVRTFYEVSPVENVVATSTPSPASSPQTLPLTTTVPSITSSPLPVTPSPTPSPTPKPKATPVGAIVGGVVGGLAVIAIFVAALVFILRRKRNSSHEPFIGQPELVQPGDQQPPPMAEHNSKHTSYVNAQHMSMASSPPPVYQNNAYYPPPNSHMSAAFSPVPAQTSPATSPPPQHGAFQQAYAQQPAVGDDQAAAELGGYIPPRVGVSELHGPSGN